MRNWDRVSKKDEVSLVDNGQLIGVDKLSKWLDSRVMMTEDEIGYLDKRMDLKSSDIKISSRIDEHLKKLNQKS